MKTEQAVTGQSYELFSRISKRVRQSPFGRFKRKPEAYSKSDGTSVSSEYWQTEPAIPLKVIQHGIGGPPGGIISLTTCNPSDRVELLTNPVTLPRTEPSAETNQGQHANAFGHESM